MQFLLRLRRLIGNVQWLVRESGLQTRLDFLEKEGRNRHLCQETRHAEVQARLHTMEQKLEDLQEKVNYLHLHRRVWADVFGHRMLLDPTDSVIAPMLCR